MQCYLLQGPLGHYGTQTCSLGSFVAIKRHTTIIAVGTRLALCTTTLLAKLADIDKKN